MANKPKATLDTGEPGFEVEGSPGPTRRYHLDVNTDPTVPGDISPSTKNTLAAYLSRVTLARAGSSKLQNKYPIVHSDTDKVLEVSHTDAKGYPLGPQLSTYKSQFDPDSSKAAPSPAAANLEILKGRQEPTANRTVDGNALLRFKTSVDPSNGKSTLPPTTPIKKYSESLLNNRFLPDEPFDTLGDEGQGFARKYSPGSSTLELAEDNRRISYDQLAQIGPELSRLAGMNPESIAAAVGGYSPPSGDSSGGSAGASQLSLTQVQTDLLSARAVIESLASEADPTIVKKLSIASSSWSSLNTVFDNYSGMSSSSMHILALALIRSACVAIKILSESLQNFDLTTRTLQRKDRLARLPYGSYEAVAQPQNYEKISQLYDQLATGQSTVWEIVGLKRTQSKFNECLSIGALAFFGVDGGLNQDTHLNLGSTNNAGVQNPGFDAVNSRAIARALLLASDAFASSTKSALGVPQPPPGPAEAQAGTQKSSSLVAARAFNTVMSLRDSKAVSLLNVLAQLGDSIVSYKGYTNDTQVRGIGKKHSSVDTALNTDAMTKSRIREGNLKLSWSSHRARDILIVPNVVLNTIMRDASSKSLGAPTLVQTEFSDEGNYASAGYRMTNSDHGSNTYGTNDPRLGGRIPTEMRESIENDLDAEYMPFYFHDVRTNEIVSFHAFLSKLTDDLQASYDSVEGFGRVEPVRIYKGTTRKIGLTFVLAALDEKDFDSMWTKINKLTTLLYPQYTEGTQIKSADATYSFYQPFSQIISSPPMIRLRVGDVIQSNYSKFNLARLFGYGQEKTSFGQSMLNAENGSKPGVIPDYMFKSDSVKNLHENVLTYLTDSSRRSYYRESWSRFYTSSKLIDPYQPPGDQGPAIKPRPTILPRGLLLKYSSPDPTDSESYWGLYEVVLATTEEDPSAGWNYLEAVKKRYANPDNPEEQIVGQKYLFSFSELVPTRSTVAKALKIADIGKGDEWVRPKREAPPAPPKDKPPAVVNECPAEPRQTELNEGLSGKKRNPSPSDDVKAWQTFLGCINNKKYAKTLRGPGDAGKYGPIVDGVHTGVDGYHGPYTQKATEEYLADKPALIAAQKEQPQTDPAAAAAGAATDTPPSESADKPLATLPYSATELPDDVGKYESSYTDDIVSFMNDDISDPRKGNAVAKSFRSSGGRGLAGFIESMSFNWIDSNVTWAGVGAPDGIGNRAPMYAEISVSFTPVHDISPGIDSQGFNRAPIYPVGPFAPMIKPKV